MLWHWGDNGVFKGFVMADPKSKSGVVLFANKRTAGDRETNHRRSDWGQTLVWAIAWLK